MLFLPPNSIGTTLCTYFPLTLCKIYPLPGVYPYNTIPLIVLLFTYQKEGLITIGLPDSITGLLMPAYNCLWNNQEEEIKILTPFFLIDSWLWALILYKSIDSSWGIEGRHSYWGMNLLYSPLCRLRIKATFLFPPYSVSIIFIDFSEQRKSRFWPATTPIYSWTNAPCVCK